MEFKVNAKLHIKAILLAVAIGYIFKNYIDRIFDELDLVLINYEYPVLMFFVVLGAILTIMIITHELMHGLGYKLFKGQVEIGFKGIYAYTRETTGKQFSGKEMIIILLLPLLLSIPALIYPHWILKFILFFNLVGSTGDLIMTSFILRNGVNGKIKDTETGFILDS